jgi:triphosphatase
VAKKTPGAVFYRPESPEHASQTAHKGRTIAFMQEIELKFQIPEGALAAVAAQLQGLAGGQDADIALRAAYFDTTDRKLGAARMALRVRQEGPDWVQTLKAGGSNTMMRLEDNQPVPAPPGQGQALQADLGRHTGLAREALTRVLGWQPEQDPSGAQTGLVELYGTDITRTRVQLAVGQGTAYAGVVELALDLGHIHAGPLKVAVRELEIESVSGHPMAVIEAGRDWVRRHGLWLDTQTKAHRGDRLARAAAAAAAPEPAGGPRQERVEQPLATAQVTLGRPAKIKADATLDQAWRAGVESCLEHITGNLSEMASLAPADHQEAAYQLRRALRRLRALGRLFQDTQPPLPAPAQSSLHEAMRKAASLARQLGYWRDQEALAWIPERLAGLGAPHMPLPHPPAPEGQPASAIEVARSALATEVCLDLLGALLSTPGDEQAHAPFKPWLSAQLDRRHHRCSRDAQAFDALTPEGRHALRKRARQLRDICDLYAPLWPQTAHEEHGKALRSALSALGNIQDEQVAHSWYQRAAAHDHRALFACGWLQGRQEALATEARHALRQWAKVSAPW